MNKKSKQVRELGIPELKAKVEELKKDYAKEIVKNKIGAKNEKAVNLKNMRKSIARALTILTEKEYAALNKEKKSETKTEVKTEKPKVAAKVVEKATPKKDKK